MITTNPIWRLMRLHQPTGIWLLFWPCWWSITLASHSPSLRLLILFGIGAVVMRGAGCVVNDIVDRDFDKHVERTRTRPLASGELSVQQAILLLLGLLCIALIIALQMNVAVLLLAFSSLAFVVSYPFMKRITWWPQAFLGLTFNWGALMGWTAVHDKLGLPAIALYVGGIFWTLGYDTIYAHQDKIDDIKIGVKSTALRLGAESKTWIAGFYIFALLGWLIAGWLAGKGNAYYVLLAFAAAQFVWQVKCVNLDDSASCLKMFRSNVWLGLIVFIGLLIS